MSRTFSFLGLRLLLGAVAWLLAASLHAQNISVSARIEPPVARANQVVTYVIDIQGGQVDTVPQLRFPLQVNQATAMSRQQSFQIRNGVQSISSRLSWGIVASEPGEFVIPAQRVVVGGREYVSNEVQFKVDNSAGPQGAEDQLTPLLQLELGKREIYQGEVVPVVANLYVPRQVQLRRVGLIEMQKSDVAIARFPQMAEQSATTVDGVGYLVMGFRSTLSSLKEGALKVGPASVEVLVDVPVGDASGRQRNLPPGVPPGFFGNLPQGFFPDMMEPRKISVKSQTVSVTVLALPKEGRPAGFSGAVGEFSMQASVQSTDLAVGDPLSVEIQVAGSGNFDALPTPALGEPQGWKVYPAKRYVIEGPTDQNQTPTLERRIGFTQVLVAEAVHRVLPAFEIHYFSPTQKKYVTLRTSPIALNMKPQSPLKAGEPAPAAALAASAAAAAAAAAAVPVPIPTAEISDIVQVLPAKPRWVLMNSSPPIWQQRWFWWLQSLPLSAWLLAWLWRVLRMRGECRRQGRRGELLQLLERAESAVDRSDAEFLKSCAVLIEATDKVGPREGDLNRLMADYEAVCFSGRVVAASGWDRGSRQRLIRTLRGRMRAAAAALCMGMMGFGSLFAQAPAALDADQVYTQALEFLQRGDHLRAQHGAESLLKANPPRISPELFELLGHARYRQGDLGRAALWYQRSALLGSPSRELRQNLRHLRERSRLFEFTTSGLPGLAQRVMGRSSWLLVAACCWSALFLLAALRQLRPGTKRFSRAWLGLLALSAAGALGMGMLSQPVAERIAGVEVVVLPDVSAHTSASEASGTVIGLPVGTQVRVLQRRGAWAYVEVPAEESALLGWVNASALTPLWPYGIEWLPR